MSVTTIGPRTPVARRMIESARSNVGEPSVGVLHPSTQLAVAAPRVGRGDAGGDGGGTGVGEAVVDTGVIGGEDDDDGGGPS
jgi:hypothetical protein